MFWALGLSQQMVHVVLHALNVKQIIPQISLISPVSFLFSFEFPYYSVSLYVMQAFYLV